MNTTRRDLLTAALTAAGAVAADLTNAQDRDHDHCLGDKPQHVYCVRFAARELWGEQAVSRDSVYADLWDDHLEPA
jgi:hypothetical protein